MAGLQNAFNKKTLLSAGLLALFLILPKQARAERLFYDGFEFGTNSCTACGYVAVLTAAPTIDATSKRSGDYGMHLSSLVSGQDKGFRHRQLSTGTTVHWYWRGYLYLVSAPGVNDSTIFAIAGGSTQNTFGVRLRLNDDMTITVIDEDGTVGTSAALSTGQWYRVEIDFDNTTVAGSNVVTLRIDGVDSVTASNRSIGTTITGFRIGANLNSEANATGEWYWDDIALNDTTGGSQTSYPGSGKIVHMTTDSDGTTTYRGTQGIDWDTGPSTGGNAYQMVDESPDPNDATDYIALMTNSTAPNSGTGVLYFNLESSASAGIGASDTITLAAVRSRVARASAANTAYRQIIKSDSTYSESSTIAISVDGWFWDLSGDPRFSRLIAYTDPNTGSAWTTSGLDAVEVGVRATDADPDHWVSQVLMSVEYVPASVLSLPHIKIRGGASAVKIRGGASGEVKFR